MKISDVHSAKGEKFKLIFVAGQVPAGYSEDGFVRISKAGRDTEFYAESGKKQYLCSADESTADYINALLQDEQSGIMRSLFVVEGVSRVGAGQIAGIEVQAYCFRSLAKHRDPIVIRVSQKVLEKTTTGRLKEEFVWGGLGQPAVFSLSYKPSVKKKADIRLLSGRRVLHADNTDRGLTAWEVQYDRYRDRASLPVDIYIAPSIEFVEEGDISCVNAEFESNLEQISKAATYFARWEAYNELEKKQIEKQAEEFGRVAYSSVKKSSDMDGTRFEFSISEKVSSEYVGSEVEVITGRDGETGGDMAGQIEKISDGTLVTYRQDTGVPVVPPPKGGIKLSTRGGKTIVKRREIAKRRMLDRCSPIRYIIRLVEEGISEFCLESNWGRDQAVTAELKRNFAEAEKLNDEQRKALEIAINTPDIALIQGPPGTGKTTVIKAVCERFREIFEAKQRQELGSDDITRRPKILISSFQNDAVENAISKPLRGDMPAYRIGGAEKAREQFQKSLDRWYDEIKKSFENEAPNPEALAVIEQKRKLSDEFFAYKNCGEHTEAAIEIIRKYLSFTGIKYPGELAGRARAIVEEYKKRACAVDQVEDPVMEKLKRQRLTEVAFADDGADQARRLAVHLKKRPDLNISQDDIGAVSAVCSGGEPDAAVFDRYVKTVSKLRAEFYPAMARENLLEKGKIEKCILELATAYSNGYFSMTDDLEAKKVLVTGEFLERFENEYARLVEKYSHTTAATCQSSMQLKKGGAGIRDSGETYDLVIIDEAARANPLDLFIPMSMGRKIILVGDHRQLPQMLEPDVLKLILDDLRYMDLPDIRISLFERLYGMFSSGQNPKAIQLNTQYRMHPDVCDFVSNAFYDGALRSGISAADREIPQKLFDGKAIAYTNIPDKCGQEHRQGGSKARPAEVEAVIEDIKRIFAAVPDSTVGVITFYSAQEALLNERVRSALDDVQFSKVEIGTVDAFQGKEFDFVLLSCVRSNRIRGEENMQQSIGFLAKPNRTCVAFSRAKRQLSVYGDADTLNQIDCFKTFFDKCKQEGCYRER